jgi:hypothetical protein
VTLYVGGLDFYGAFGLADPQSTGKLRPSDIITIFTEANSPSEGFKNLFDLELKLGVRFGVYVQVSN